MDTCKPKWTRLQAEIFRLLCIKAGSQLSQREISIFLKVSPTAVSKSLGLLEKGKIILREKQKNMNLILIRLNRDNQKAMQLKRVENLEQIYESGLLEFLEESLSGATIILFGSYSRGDDTIKSDIDIAVIGRKEKVLEFEKFEKLLGRKVILNFYDSLPKIHKNLKENICNGIVLSGGVML